MATSLNSDGRPRDTQRQRLYSTCWAGTSPAATRYLDGGSKTSAGSVSIPACQAYVDDLVEQRWFQSRWGRRRIPVGHKVWGNATWDGYDISLPPWARSEDTILHEVAHALTPRKYAAHGPEFAGVLMTLVRHRVGAPAAQSLRESFRDKRVRMNLKAVPDAGSKTVVTKTAVAAKTRAAATKPPTAIELAQAADVIRRAAKNGAFGPSGRKPREHALATARMLG